MIIMLINLFCPSMFACANIKNQKLIQLFELKTIVRN